jgi:hypothetical protein
MARRVPTPRHGLIKGLGQLAVPIFAGGGHPPRMRSAFHFIDFGRRFVGFALFRVS